MARISDDTDWPTVLAELIDTLHEEPGLGTAQLIERWRDGGTGVDFVHAWDTGKPGPRVMIQALTHGNEICGAIALERLLAGGFRAVDGASPPGRTSCGSGPSVSRIHTRSKGSPWRGPAPGVGVVEGAGRHGSLPRRFGLPASGPRGPGRPVRAARRRDPDRRDRDLGRDRHRDRPAQAVATAAQGAARRHRPGAAPRGRDPGAAATAAQGRGQARAEGGAQGRATPAAASTQGRRGEAGAAAPTAAAQGRGAQAATAQAATKIQPIKTKS